MSTLSAQNQLDAHQTAPQELKDFFKFFKGKLERKQLSEIIDFDGTMILPGLQSIPQARILNAFSRFINLSPISFSYRSPNTDADADEDAQALLLLRLIHQPRAVPFSILGAGTAVFAVRKIPGLMFVPGLIPTGMQKILLSSLLHYTLSDPKHSTNLHMHYDFDYAKGKDSLFSYSQDEYAFMPKDPSIHKPLTMRQVLEKKLRWVTLGGQYDWTQKVYPAGAISEFPRDVAHLVGGLFPDMEPQAAIVNLYSPGDTLSMHRDGSEEVDKGLVSISLGCDCIFTAGHVDTKTGEIEEVAIRLKSGDALYMTGKSRLAWHGVPKIIPDTCPAYISDWPGTRYPEWRGWMKNKRINLNVRQMRESVADPMSV